MRRSLGLSLGLLLASSIATLLSIGVARADLVAPPPAELDCPPGSAPAVVGCAPLGCTGAVDCERGPCQEIALCIGSRAGQAVALGRCGPNDECPFGECSRAPRCVGVELDGTASPPPLPEGVEARLREGGEAQPPMADPNATPPPAVPSAIPRIVDRASAESVDRDAEGGCGCRAAPGAPRSLGWMGIALAIALVRRSFR